MILHYVSQQLKSLAMFPDYNNSNVEYHFKYIARGFNRGRQYMAIVNIWISMVETIDYVLNKSTQHQLWPKVSTLGDKIGKQKMIIINNIGSQQLNRLLCLNGLFAIKSDNYEIVRQNLIKKFLLLNSIFVVITSIIII